jgi:hypothetical protein
MISTAGLYWSGSPGFVFLFTLALVFFSLGKPSPDRMVRLMKFLKGRFHSLANWVLAARLIL